MEAFSHKRQASSGQFRRRFKDTLQTMPNEDVDQSETRAVGIPGVKMKESYLSQNRLPKGSMKQEMLVYNCEAIDTKNSSRRKSFPSSLTSFPGVKDDYSGHEDAIREWCGGYRDRITNVCYYNTWTQTRSRYLQRLVKKINVFKSSKITQTPNFPILDREIETDHSVSVQTWRYDLHILSHADKIVQPRNFRSEFESSQRGFLLNLIILKRFKDLCRKKAKEYKEVMIQKQKEELLKRKRDELKDAHVQYTTETIFPTRRIGFENLYHHLSTWYENEKNKILKVYGNVKDRGYRTSLLLLFSKKVDLLKQIDKLRIEHRDEALRKKLMKKFEAAAISRVVMHSKGNVSVVNSQMHQRAMEFREIYSTYLKEDFTREERIATLMDINKFLGSFEQNDLTMPIIELINREIDLNVIKAKHLDGLKKRISDLLYSFLTHQDFKLKGFTKWDDRPRVTYECPSCRKLKPPSGFSKCTTVNPRYCTACAWLLDRVSGRPGLQPYMIMLEQIRQEDDPSNNCIPFLMTPLDVETLVLELWAGRSILSGIKNKLSLRLPKWDKKRPWTPWNCVLLTVNETILHREFENVESCYNEDIVNKVRLRHLKGKRRFLKLREIEYTKKDRDVHLERAVPKERLAEIRKTKYYPFLTPVHYNVRRGY